MNSEPIAKLIQESLAISASPPHQQGARLQLAKRNGQDAMPLMVNFFSGWLDYPRVFFFWCYSGRTRSSTRRATSIKDMDKLIDGARSAAAISDLAEIRRPDVKASSPSLSRRAAHPAVPAVSQRRDAEEHFRLLLLVPPAGRLPLAGQGLMRSLSAAAARRNACGRHAD